MVGVRIVGFTPVVNDGILSSQKDSRREAIDRLVEKRDTTNLGVLVRTGGLVGELRRYALEGLGRCSATNELESVAEDRTLEPSLRDRAAELA